MYSKEILKNYLYEFPVIEQFRFFIIYPFQYTKPLKIVNIFRGCLTDNIKILAQKFDTDELKINAFINI